MKNILVLGIGNLLLNDDGVGVHAVHQLLKEEWPECVKLLDAGTFTQDVFYLFEGYEELIILDIVHAGKEPGSLYRLSEEQLVHKESRRLSIHDIDLLDSLDMAEKLHGKRPRLTIIGMEPQDFTSWSMELSPAAQEKFPAFLELARQEIHNCMESAFVAQYDPQ